MSLDVLSPKLNKLYHKIHALDHPDYKGGIHVRAFPRRMQAVREAVARYGIPKKFLPVYDDSLKNIGPVFVHGPVGTGKTYFLVSHLKAVLYDYLENASSPVNDNSPLYRYPSIEDLFLFSDASDLIVNMRTSYLDDMVFYNHVREVPHLYIDDIGAVKFTEWSAETFGALINHRYNEELFTCFSSNLHPDDLVDYLDSRVVSRISSMCEAVEMNGPDRRKG